MKKKILDVGCGNSKIISAIGVDFLDLPNVDVVHDLNIFPWPFEEEYFDKIVFSHSISHLENIIKVINETHRILKPGGTIEIVAPHYSSDNFNTDPTHKFHIGIRSMNYFVSNISFGYRYVNSNIRFNLLNATISFREANVFWRKHLKFNIFKVIGIEYLVNCFPRIYEKYFCLVFPASEVYFRLQKW